MFDFAGYFAAIKRHWVLFLITIVVAVVFLGGTIAGLYNKLRSTVPGASALPAPKV